MTVLYACLATGGLGYTFGYYMGRIAASMEVPTMPDTQTSHPNVWRILLLFVSTVMVVVGITVWQQNVAIKRQQECMADYAAASAEAQKVRTDANERKDGAVDEVLLSVVPLMSPDRSEANRERFRLALLDYQRTKAQLDAAREANPYPPFPASFCEEPAA